MDNKPGLVLNHQGSHALAIKKPGLHKVKISFNIQTDLQRGPQSINFPIPRTPITLLSMSIPFPSVKPEIPSAQAIASKTVEKETQVEAVLTPTNSISASWSRVIPEAEKGPAKVYADLYHLLSIEDDTLRVSTNISLNVLQNTINGLTLLVPKGYQILNVSGGNVGDWKERNTKDQPTLEVAFKAPTQGNHRININAEKNFSEKQNVADFTGFKVLNAVREKGFMAVELKSNAEVKVPETAGIDRISLPELPSELRTRSQKPLIFAYKYLRHPYSLVLDVQKHESLPVVSTVIDKAFATTLFTEDGKRVHQVTYSVRNTWKQFLELDFPKNSELWSVFIDGKAVKPTRNEEGKTLIPLNRSREGSGGLTAFDVELIYFEKTPPFGWFGQKKQPFVVPDVMISRILWSVYLPVESRVISFGGKMKKEKIASGLRPFLGMDKRVINMGLLRQNEVSQKGNRPQAAPAPGRQKSIASKDEAAYRARIAENVQIMKKRKELRSDFGDSMPVSEMEVAEQLYQEMDFGNKMDRSAAGVLPIRVDIPAVGQLYRFAQQIVTEDKPNITFIYLHQDFVSIVRLVLILFLLWFLFYKRSDIRELFERTITTLSRQKKWIHRLTTPGGLAILSVLLFFVAGSVFRSPLMMLFFASVMVVSLVRYFSSQWRQNKNQGKKDL